MNAVHTDNWYESNLRYLMASIAQVSLALERYIAYQGDISQINQDSPESPAMSTMPRPPAIENLCKNFGLSAFERNILLLCVGMEMNPRFSSLCAAAHGDSLHTYPTFSLAMEVLPGAHWSALNPAAPLRHWHFIEVGQGETLSSSPLRVDERILHYLAGVTYLDERLQNLLEPVPFPGILPISYRAYAERIVHLWSQGLEDYPIIQLCGNAKGDKRMLSAAGCSALGMQLYVLRAADIPNVTSERDMLIRLLERETILSRSALLLECDESDEPAFIQVVQRFIERINCLLFVTGSMPLNTGKHQVARLVINLPPTDEQHALWQSALGSLAKGLNGQLDALVSYFPLDTQSILAASRTLNNSVSANQPELLIPMLWEVCRAQGRPPLENLAYRIEPVAKWDDLILPEEQMQVLRDMAAFIRQRRRVYETWGFAASSTRGLGISALFAGTSGTGKTMAAEVLANDLNLDIYRIDLSQVISKYIGETEKNLRRIFDAAEHSGAILLFDEADALFGKRSEVRDSHDRYANIEVSYLLQRMEAYRGLAILTTNQRSALDTAFLRRLRFVVLFPFPDAAQRIRIWERIFPVNTPTEGLDISKLSKLNISGGNIRNIALNAAFLAAEMGEPVRMTHLLRTARSECAKLEKPVTAAEIGDWV